MASVCAVHYVSTPGDMAPYEPLVTLRVYRAQTTVPEPYGTDADWGQGTFRSNYDHERSPRAATGAHALLEVKHLAPTTAYSSIAGCLPANMMVYRCAAKKKKQPSAKR